MSDLKRAALVLAAGMGTRFKSKKPKVLHELCGSPLVVHVLRRLRELELDRVVVVVGHEGEVVRSALQDFGVEFVFQEEQLGTGHAVMTAQPHLEGTSGWLLVLYGDTPLITSGTLARLLETAQTQEADGVVLTATYDDPTGYGRILRDSRGELLEILEEREAGQEQKGIREINAGLYCFRVEALREGLSHLFPSPRTGEYYLPDLIRILRRAGKKVLALPAASVEETYGINDRAELAQAGARMRRRIAHHWMIEGVTLVDPDQTYIDASVEIGPETAIYPGTVLEGRTRIGSGCTIYSCCHLRNAELEDGVLVEHGSVIRESRIRRGSRVGPFAHIRLEAVIETEAKIGNFVEVKKSVVGPRSKANHLAYLGDAQVGADVNIGAGVITCNYDGVRKHQTVIEDGVFVGSDSQLIAPVKVGKGAYVAAGSAITEEVPPGALGIARARQVNKEGWTKKRMKDEG